MHILVATAGALPPEPVSALVDRCLAGSGTVSVLTVIGVPRVFLDSLEEEGWHPFHDSVVSGQSSEDLAVTYLEERGSKRIEPVMAALRARGIDAEPLYREGDDAAAVISATAEDLTADLIVMGATRPIFNEDAWTSVSIRVMEDSTMPVLLVPGSVPAVDSDEAELVSTAAAAEADAAPEATFQV